MVRLLTIEVMLQIRFWAMVKVEGRRRGGITSKANGNGLDGRKIKWDDSRSHSWTKV